MKWFKHDSDASIDAKIEKLIMRYGLKGYGLYFYCLELIVASIEEHNLTFELEHDAEIIGHRTGTHPDAIQEMMKFIVDLGLFENNDGTITCYKILKRLDSSMTSNPKLRAIIKNSHDAIMMQSCRNHDSVMLEEKEEKEEKNSSSDDERDFEEFWKRYPRKQDKKKARTAFLRLSKKKRELATKDCAARYEGTERRFIPIPTTYIHGERWDDEIESKPDNLSDYAKGGI